MTAVERLFQYFDFKGIKYTPAERELNLSNGYLGKMRARGASIGSEIIEKIILKYPDISPEWLLTGAGQMLRGNESIISSEEKPAGPCLQCELREEIINEKNEVIALLKDKIRSLNDQLKDTGHDVRQTG